MLQVRENEISLRKWSGGTAQLRTAEETLSAMKFTKNAVECQSGTSHVRKIATKHLSLTELKKRLLEPSRQMPCVLFPLQGRCLLCTPNKPQRVMLQRDHGPQFEKFADCCNEIVVKLITPMFSNNLQMISQK